MRKRRTALAAGSLLVLIAVAALVAWGAGSSDGGLVVWSDVDAAMGLDGSMVTEDVHKYSISRRDLAVNLDGVRVDPDLALTSWVTFKRIEGTSETLAMGDLVLRPAEAKMVIPRLQEGNVSVTALHNHLIGEEPDVKFLHIQARGDPVETAQALRKALEATGTPLNATNEEEESDRGRARLDMDQLDEIIGYNGTGKNDVYTYSIPRELSVTVNATEIPPPMGTAIALGFQPTGEGKAAATGDFVLAADEVNPVVHALGENGINVTALHNHMVHEEPRLFFMHFWAHGDAMEIARGLRAALNEVEAPNGA